ncbi:MAG: helix-turn-helix transcriptional regulator [Chitinophagales bacterium]
MNRIKEILKDKGISQTWLAKQIGKSYNTINEYARNVR